MFRGVARNPAFLFGFLVLSGSGQAWTIFLKSPDGRVNRNGVQHTDQHKGEVLILRQVKKRLGRFKFIWVAVAA
jgi:hypothetical protein